MSKELTREEFETWITTHYSELLSVAIAKRYQDPEDVVQAAVVRMLRNPTIPQFPWTWAVNALRNVAHNNHRSARRRTGLAKKLKKDSRAGVYIRGRRKNPIPRQDDLKANEYRGGVSNKRKGER